MKRAACFLVTLTLSIGSARAVTVAYTGTGASAGANAGSLDIGHQFSVTGSGITLQQLGVFDAGGDGLASAHTVTFFTLSSGAGAAGATATPITGGSLTVPSGTSATLDSGFRFSSLAAPLFLAPGNYSLIAYGLSSGNGDSYGDGGGLPTGGNVNDIRFDPFQFTTAGSPTYPTGGDANNHASASFRYDLGNTAVPEPATWALLGVGGLVALANRARRRS